MTVFTFQGCTYNTTGPATCRLLDMDTSVESLIIPEQVRDSVGTLYTVTASIGTMSSSNIRNIVLPLTLVNIGGGSFRNLTKLFSFSSPGAQQLGEVAFEGDSSLPFLNLPAVTSVGNTAFKDCTSLRAIRLPLLQQYTAQDAFSGCTSLAYVYTAQNYVDVSFNADTFADAAAGMTVYYQQGRIWPPTVTVGARTIQTAPYLTTTTLTTSGLVAPGQPLVLTATTAAPGVLLYSFYHNGTFIGTSTTPTFTPSSSLKSEEVGTYTVEVLDVFRGVTGASIDVNAIFWPVKTPGADHESIRASREAAACPPTQANTAVDTCIVCTGPAKRQHEHHRLEAPSEVVRIITEATACRLYALNHQTGGLCGATTATVHTPATPPLVGSTPPHRVHGYRTFARVRGIDELTRLARSTSSSEVTARRRVNVENAAATAQRHQEHFRVHPPPPPRLCRPPQVLPQAGVPLAPVTPCNLGNQRVDYTNPRR